MRASGLFVEREFGALEGRVAARTIEKLKSRRRARRKLEGVAHRGCFDLGQHQEHGSARMEYIDPTRDNARYLPNVIEPASGLTRAVLVLL